ncbi:hypothetical protein B484DRAFT_398556 [Ochromonadaceae sp. CCMP2298]|nr:hypothetical protein B484DRAFT_398556 [Ochromonadaceae sp. CCMP2298]|mmetsp:Transcript_16956/g.38255  ORF Transcript_16956/g.38255 Transcript_16956/m.38255 type:complete len:1478 (-) Transcript_16956:83-4516(-)|eukprot:CAMPEP_0173178936 /NCGR_PEP_ID=MMETSP1141-20130122/5826_1 /TAXON_ID=483371 /ORGANISM="non described non described, Strain CCMP2298" /LENGTH=1477 /DNA_ID=CAMNT_0014101509 /DNA_START=137 /DNA_END=4570 /DNA_ORIENTATION=-
MSLHDRDKAAENAAAAKAKVLKSIKPNGIDFDAMAREHGFVKARQLLAQATIRSQQETIKRVERDLNASKAPLRLKESIYLASTFGKLDSDSVLDRIMKGNQAHLSQASQIDMLEAILSKGAMSSGIGTSTGTGAGTGKPDVETITIPASPTNKNSAKSGRIEGTKSGHTEGEAETNSPLDRSRTQEHARPVRPQGPDGPSNRFLDDDTLRYTLEGDDYNVLIPNKDATGLPQGLGDTLHLQLSYTRRLTCTRNLLRNLLSHEIPMLSMYHMRYLTHVNLSFNKIQTLPFDFGVLSMLQQLDLSYNNLSALPDSIQQLKQLTALNLSNNSFASLPDAFSYLDALVKLNLSNNLFAEFPCMVVRLRSLKMLKFSQNSLIHLAVPPALLKPADMWTTVLDHRTGKTVQMNILTKEKVANIEKYEGKGLKRMQSLHVFQAEGTKPYRTRKTWLSLNQIQEWDTASDPQSGLTYYRNNVSGGTQWEMPHSLDTIGNLAALEEMEVKQNSIKSLPMSFVLTFTLRRIVFTKNRIQELPHEIGALKKLEWLELSSNELKVLPTSICECESLETLLLSDNHLLRLPNNLGRLPRLKRLDVCANHLKSISFSLGYCYSLESILATENPLEDPPHTQFSKGIDALRWYLRSRYMIDERGMPPEMTFHQIGVCNQITEVEPDFAAIVRMMIAASARDGLLNLQLLGLREIPIDVLRMKNLKRLKLDFNDTMELAAGFPLELKSLLTLSLRACKMDLLPENVHIFEGIKSLSIHENRFESLPDGIAELRTLTYLDVSKNRIYNLPEDFVKLTKLTTLNLESNNLETIPELIYKLSRLKTLNLARNRLTDCPHSIAALAALKVLNLEKNHLCYLPDSIGELNVVDLRVGHNDLEYLPPEMFSSNLGQAIKWFSCCECNLMELPWSISKIDREAYVDADFNPLISPPPYLLSEGLGVLQNYLYIRKVRRELFQELIEDEDFVLSEASMSPVAFEVLQDGTGFLSPDDLGEFDQAVDEYLNAEYYRCPATAEEIVQSLTSLRESRETEIYLTILYTFLKTIKKIEDSDDVRFGSACLFMEERPWGRRSENVQVYVISLLALLRDAAPNPFQPEGRPSLFSMVGAALPPLAFPFTVDLLKDAIRLYISPYGQVADTEQVTFPACDCVDDVRSKPKRHNPCPKAAVVLCKSIYIPEEANRREIEEDEFLSRFAAVEDDVRIWLATDEGRVMQEKEIKVRKNTLKEEILIRDEMSFSQVLKMKKAQDALASVTRRKDQLDEGEPYESHGFRTRAEALQAVNEAADEIAKIEGRLKVLKEQIKQMKVDLAQDYNSFHVKTASDVVHKYCLNAYWKHISKFRVYALKYNLNRYWDGADGAAFTKWRKTHSYAGNTDDMDDMMRELEPKRRGSGSGPGLLKRTDSNSSIRSNTSAKSNVSGKSNVSTASNDGYGTLAPEYNFKDLTDMSKYALYVYSRYRKERDDLLSGAMDLFDSL